MISKKIIIVFILGLMVSLIPGCSDDKPKLCCLDVGDSDTSPERSYCLDHEVAVQMFIQEPSDTSGQRQRLQAFRRFFEMVRSCHTVNCIQAAIDTTSLVPELKVIYDDEHSVAEEDLSVAPERKADLIKCGFQHAIAVGID